MTRRPTLRLAVGLLAACALAACGKKGPPLAPLRPVPGRLADLAAVRIDGRVELHFTIPAANADGTTPSVIERVDIYERFSATGAPAPTVNQIVQDASDAVGHVDVRRPDQPAATGPPRRPAPGEPATFVDPAGAGPARPGGGVRHYVLVGVAGRRRQTSPRLDVPMSSTTPPPQNVRVTYDQQMLTLTWEAGKTGEVFRVSDVDDQGRSTGQAAAAPTPPDGTTFTTAVAFGRRRCFSVRALEVSGPVSIASVPTPPVCVTPVDTFPPPPPEGLLAFAGAGHVTLTWRAVTAADLAGYLVLRGEGSGERLQPLMTSPIAATRYEDATARPGVRYVYAVVAVDTSPQHNISALSNRQTVVSR